MYKKQVAPIEHDGEQARPMSANAPVEDETGLDTGAELQDLAAAGDVELGSDTDDVELEVRSVLEALPRRYAEALTEEMRLPLDEHEQRRARASRPPEHEQRVRVRALENINFGFPAAARYAIGQIVTTTESNARQLIATRQAEAIDELSPIDRGPRRGRPMSVRTRSMLRQLQLRATAWIADGSLDGPLSHRERSRRRKQRRAGRTLERDLALVAAALVYRAEGPNAGETPTEAWARVKDSIAGELRRLLEDQRAIASPAAPHEAWATRSPSVAAIESSPSALG
jgi:hypothetical protein